MDMQDAVRINSHEPSTGCVSGYRIVGQNNRTDQTRRSIQRSVSFHTNDTVGAHKMDRNGRAQIDDALVDSFPVENNLRPAVLGAWTHFKHVLEAQCDPALVISFHLAHAHVKSL